MIGVDIVSIQRIKAITTKFGDKFLAKFLSPDEIALVRLDSTYNFNRIAGFFATKEAVSKALGCGIGGKLRFLDIIIKKDFNNSPYVLLSREASMRFSVYKINVTISHDRGFAVAVAFVAQTKVYRLLLQDRLSNECLNELELYGMLEVATGVSLYSANKVFAISLFVGIFGVDRFYLGDFKIGVLKLLFAILIVPYIVDLFIIKKRCKAINDKIVRKYLMEIFK